MDKFGLAVPDPTENVKALNEAGLKSLAAILDLNVKREDDLREMESGYRDKIEMLRSEHAKEVRQAESQRVNDIRQVDVNAVAQALSAVNLQNAALAKTVTETAEASRSQVAAAESARQEASRIALEPMQKDITEIRAALYQQQGQKTGLDESKADRTTHRGTSQWLIGLIAAVILGMFTTFVSAAVVLIIHFG